MLLLWSRLAALALLASLASCSPVSPSPLKDVDTALSREPAHRNEQIINLTKQGISVSPTLDFNSTSILSRRFSHEVLPAIALCSPGATYSPGDKFLIKWNKSLFYTQADIWIQYSGKKASAQSELLQMHPRKGRKAAATLFK
ncbi:BQ5605_C030g10809 [Microbotryum silenes-dioicae]|uniref:BQ5605_C030g10809 protein n=1 Tax=Microbotryum silenes-dioicae TaxID=796604 RepID=A0A2X0MI55_9BASI|nr:BQ5605_C030g10809 [Microbotryum silenes-dioicae]